VEDTDGRQRLSEDKSLKRTASEILRRGFNNALANWQLILIRIAEGIVFLGIGIAAVFAAFVPLAVSIGLNVHDWSVDEAVDIPTVLLDVFARHWIVLVYMFLIASVVLLVIIAIHSFVDAGAALIYVDAERRTKALPAATRDDFRSFTGERWMKGGSSGWWTVFWIYNLGWGAGGLIMMIPLLVVAVAMLALRGSGPGAMLATGCTGGAVSLMFLILVAIVTNVWCEKAVVDCMASSLRAGAALRTAWREMRTDTGRHLGVAIVMMAIALGGSMFLSSFSWIGAVNHSAGFSVATLPLRFSASFANTIFSTAVGAWFLASFAALAVESRA